MRVFLDANTLISGIVFTGLEHDVLKLGLKGKAELITSEDVIEEVLEVLKRKFPNKLSMFAEFMRISEIKVILRKDYSNIVEEQNVRDIEDRHVLAAAINSASKIIITGDKDLQTLNTYHGIQIISSRKLLELVK